MFFGGRATGRPNFRPFSGLRAPAGARLARSPRAVRSPLLWASTSARFDGTFGVDRLQVDHVVAFDHAQAQSLVRFKSYNLHGSGSSSSAEGRDYSKAPESTSIRQAPLLRAAYSGVWRLCLEARVQF